MEITLLGTGSIYSKYNCASCIIDRKILIDIGPGTVKELLKLGYKIQDIDIILITHLHSDHILDFPSFIVNTGVLKSSKNIKIIGPKGIKEKFLILLKLLYGNYFDEFIKKHIEFIEIDSNFNIINNNQYKIGVKEVSHFGIKAYGYIINEKVGVTGDSSICKGVKDIFNNSDIMIADCSLIKGDKFHMGIDNIEELIKRNPNKIIILTHLRDDTREVFNNKNIKNVIIQGDGYSYIV